MLTNAPNIIKQDGSVYRCITAFTMLIALLQCIWVRPIQCIHAV